VRLIRNIGLSRKALWRHRARTALALVATAVGVAAVLAMLSVAEGAKREVIGRIDAMGRNLLVVMAGPQPRIAGRTVARGATVTTLRPTDSDAIVERCALIARVAPSQDRTLPIEFADRATTATVRGTTPAYRVMRSFPLVGGRDFTAEENRAGRRVAVIGARVRERLFPDRDPVGETFRVGRIPFEVVGVLESRGVSLGGGDDDNQVLIPLNTALRRVFNLDYVGTIFVEVESGTMMDAAADEVAAILRERHRLDRRNKADDFVIRNQRVVVAAELETLRSFRLLVVGLGSVALAVGGVGILSIMLLSIRERRSEIGVRAAVGARRRDIRLQFLLEAVALSGAGGVAGVGLGMGLAWAIGAFTEWHSVVTSSSVLLAALSALGVGVASGLYPALRAASWDPIVALRSA